MNTLRVTLAQTNPVAGAVTENTAEIRRALDEAIRMRSDIFLTAEKAVSGYPVEDLLGEPAFLADVEQAVRDLSAAVPDGMLAGFGAPMRTDALPTRGGALIRGAGLDAFDRNTFNVIALATGGQLWAAHSKALLPTYGVFDDSRWIVPGSITDQSTFIVSRTRVAFAICEDVWTPEVADAAAAKGAKVLLVANASPYYTGKAAQRLDMLRRTARTTGMTVVYVNAVGGQDEVVYDGGSFVVQPDGTVLLLAPLFETGTFTVDIPVPTVFPDYDGTDVALPLQQLREHRTLPQVHAEWPDADQETYQALVLGLRDYVCNNGFAEAGVVLGLSGGLDSALVAAIAVDALGPDKVLGIGLPGPYSSDHSVTDARILAENLGITFQVHSIRKSYEAVRDEMGDLLTGPGSKVADENVQARLRGAFLMNTSNARDSMMINTGNKSEASVGYFTLGADSMGGLAVLKDVLKTQAYRLAEWRNAHAVKNGQTPPIPANTISKPPSAELAPGQVDSNNLPPYPILDAILVGYLEYMKPARLIADEIAVEFDLPMDEAETVTLRVLRMTDRAEHKRRQVAPGLMVSRRPFGRGRRMPITSKREHHL